MYTFHKLISSVDQFEDDADDLSLFWSVKSFSCLVDKGKLTVHHHTEIDDPKDWEELWLNTDKLCCCMPEYLPAWARAKHVLPNAKGKISFRRRGDLIIFWTEDENFDTIYPKLCKDLGIEEVDEFD